MPRTSRRVATALATVALLAVACTGGDASDAGPAVPELSFETFDGERTSLPDQVGTPLA